jgi:hypothetical protein
MQSLFCKKKYTVYMKKLYQKFYQSEIAILLSGLLFMGLAGAVLAMGTLGTSADVDTDGDTVVDSLDKCPGTIVDKLGGDWGVGRYLWIGDSYFTVLEAVKGGSKIKTFSEFSMAQTKGCSCNDIVTATGATLGADRNTNYENGCTKGVVSGWIRDVSK